MYRARLAAVLIISIGNIIVINRNLIFFFIYYIFIYYIFAIT